MSGSEQDGRTLELAAVVSDTRGANAMSNHWSHHRSWSHPSVKALAGSSDPVETVLDRARNLVLDALQQGWAGPPFDPIALAGLLNIAVQPCQDILDARTVPLPGKRFQIEFNPNRPRGRLRYSIAHEVAHTLFPDCADQVRHRHAEAGKDWELEMLCNLAAAEILMPIGSFPQLSDSELSVDALIDLRKRFDVSFEALFLRLVKTTSQPCAVVCLSRREFGRNKDQYQIDYAVPSRSLKGDLPDTVAIANNSAVALCTAIGFTSKGEESWLGFPARIECVGIPPYPDHLYPRVLAIVVPKKGHEKPNNDITYLRGDASEPAVRGHRIIAHVVNNKAAAWGAGFARFIAKKWPEVQSEFKEWAGGSRANLQLGNTHVTEVNDAVSVFHMIAQSGYGDSTRPRIRYGALQRGLSALAVLAKESGASVHMPRIGCGQAGGDWAVVSELILDTLCRNGVPVTVYDLPNADFRERPQSSFSFQRVK